MEDEVEQTWDMDKKSAMYVSGMNVMQMIRLLGFGGFFDAPWVC